MERVLKKIKGFSKCMGMPCDKFEKEIMTLFVSIEAGLFKDYVSCVSPSSTWELKRLDYSINYTSRDSGSNSGGRRGRVPSVSL